jgi:N-methylhydantoinase A
MNYIGIDTGGTFTDIVVVNDQGQLRTYKTDSTPGDLAVGVVEGLKLAAEDMGLCQRPPILLMARPRLPMH